MANFHVPLIIRGKIIEGTETTHGGRRGGITFSTPDVRNYMDQLPLTSPSALQDLYALSMDEILEYLSELGERFKLSTNEHLQSALELAISTSGLGEEIIRYQYETLGQACKPAVVRETIENAIGLRYLEGWVPTKLSSGCVANVRAFGARCVHIIAGNVPSVAVVTAIRNAFLRSDAIVKTPSNDPITAIAVGRTMIEMAPEHPITKHFSAGYWKGGDAEVEDELYKPKNIDKIVAWGGLASVQHVVKYVQPGIDLITLDPKLSSSIIGKAAFKDDETMRAVADRLAEDVGYYNQEACVNSRVTYIQSGTDKAGLANAKKFGQYLYESIQSLPARVSGPARAMNGDLAEEIQAAKLMGDHDVIGGGKEGGVIISNESEPVDFSPLLANRISNLVPIDDLETAVQSVNAYTQTIGVYPEEVKTQIRDQCVFHGAQRLVSLGYAARAVNAGPHDGIEPLRRVLKWVTDEVNDPAIVVRPKDR